MLAGADRDLGLGPQGTVESAACLGKPYRGPVIGFTSKGLSIYFVLYSVLYLILASYLVLYMAYVPPNCGENGTGFYIKTLSQLIRSRFCVLATFFITILA